ncbi:glycosyltransferase [Sulfitobacter sp. D35]|uniref:glycosyltransferase n=1 Tax=Sulfitobacter sp. D35 TaxID=3083252 RepID=UPI00296FF6DB|nr:glycosyltransferase [Sulfitobacter sp. D35]MDW4499888.1 glycosyltransferase [Sulfitobacter sp. D35]
MNDLLVQIPDSDPARAHTPLGRHLVDEGLIDPADLDHALQMQNFVDAPLGEIMVSEGLLARDDVLRALCRQSGLTRVDLDTHPPSIGIEGCLAATFCLEHGVLPWREMEGKLYVATSRPLSFDLFRIALGRNGPAMVPIVADAAQIRAHLSRMYGRELAAKAMRRVAAVESCRGWADRHARRALKAGVLASMLAAAVLLAPLWTVTVGMIFATLTLLMTTGLKAAALASQLGQLRIEDRAPEPAAVTPFRMPCVSVLVPLLREREIAGVLIERLSRLTYPKSLLEVVLVLEEGDTVTRDTIAATQLPHWMSVVEVPESGGLTTKPRALNYALDFCQGSIVGVWDAEDWPEADQIERVVTRFNAAPPDVACLQGRLDYYNARTNWMSRCFAIEYATWWRIMLPGLARLGFVIPLGGTTLFFRRDILERLGGWDAHNVTEDADLGLRLARRGYVAELLPTVTREEATCSPWAWVRQRSRWLKGFLVTYMVHMRHPLRLWHELGPLRFFGVQGMFLATFSQFACAPLLWSLWLTFLGGGHPIEATLGWGAVTTLSVLFAMAELINLAMGLVAVSDRDHRHLMPIVPTMMLYFTLGALAAYKALWELLRAPFFWDKTQHGISPHPA